MPREKENYQKNLLEIKERFGDAQMIPLRKAAEYCGVNFRLLQNDKTFPLKKVAGRYFVSAVNFASWLS